MEIKHCKICNDEFETDIGFNEDFCDQYCFKVYQENVKIPIWKTVLDFAIHRGNPEEPLVIELIKKKVKSQ